MDLTLRTAGGELVAVLPNEASVALMTANGKPPEVVLWGQRFFAYQADMEYREVLCLVVGIQA